MSINMSVSETLLWICLINLRLVVRHHRQLQLLSLPLHVGCWHTWQAEQNVKTWVVYNLWNTQVTSQWLQSMVTKARDRQSHCFKIEALINLIMWMLHLGRASPSSSANMLSSSPSTSSSSPWVNQIFKLTELFHYWFCQAVTIDKNSASVVGTKGKTACASFYIS